MAKATRTVRVTAAQKHAAKALLVRSAKTGRRVSSSVSKIANAKPTSEITPGRYVAALSARDGTTEAGRG